MQENREHVSRFSYFWREKVSEQELSDDFGTAHGPFLLSAKLKFRDRQCSKNIHIVFNKLPH